MLIMTSLLESPCLLIVVLMCCHSHSCNMPGLLYRGSHMSVHVLLNLLNEFRKRDKMRGLPSIFISFSQRV